MARADIKVTQSIPKHLRYKMQDFNREFPNDDACLAHIAEDRFPGGISKCEKCEIERKHHRVSGRTAYACDYCGNHIYPLAGTIFEKSTTSLRMWFYAMYLMGSTRCGISAKQMQRETGVTYKTAWRMFKQIRTLMSEDLQLEGPAVEMDETYFGGRRLSTIPDDDRRFRRYEHRRINHSAGVYVVGDIHTNSVEGFWSLLKRGIGGVYHAVSQKYLQTYLDEYSFRYNRRDQGNLIFKSILSQVAGRAE